MDLSKIITFIYSEQFGWFCLINRMKKATKRVFQLLLLGCFFLATAAITSKEWKINPARVQFEGTAVEGYFEGVMGKLQFNEAQLSASSFDLYLEVASISTGNELKDEHARGSNWFNAKKYPHIRFKSSSFEKVGSTYVVEGKMHIKDVVKTVRIPFSFIQNKDEALLQSSFSLNRKDFNIQGNAIGFLVGDEIRIQLALPLKEL
jgi:polyisoprenoid-binding protein YceI